MNIDSVDLAIIKNLRKNARKTFKSVAEELGLSTSAIKLRFKKMEQSGLIRGTTAKPDFYKVGIFVTQLCIKVIESEEENVVDFIQTLHLEQVTISCWRVIGHYNIVAWIFLKDPIKLYTLKQMVQQHPAILGMNASVFTDYRRYQLNIE